MPGCCSPPVPSCLLAHKDFRLSLLHFSGSRISTVARTCGSAVWAVGLPLTCPATLKSGQPTQEHQRMMQTTLLPVESEVVVWKSVTNMTSQCKTKLSKSLLHMTGLGNQETARKGGAEDDQQQALIPGFSLGSMKKCSCLQPLNKKIQNGRFQKCDVTISCSKWENFPCKFSWKSLILKKL